MARSLTIARVMLGVSCQIRRKACVIALVICLSATASAQFPPLCVEIGPEHPLFIFQDTGGDLADPTAYAQHVVQVWKALPDDLKPLSVIQVEARGADVASRHQWYRALLVALQDGDVPAVLRLADEDLRRVYPLDRAEELLREFTCVKGVQAVGLPLEEYYEFGADDPHGTPPVVRWLVDAIDLAARYGRFMAIELDRIRWPRVMSNTWCAPLRDKMRACAAYTVPIGRCRGSHTVPQMSALLGAWIDGMTAQWGVGPDSRWYADALFLAPGVFGVSDAPVKMPPALYRAMILNGAMTGAAVYSFAPDADLWFGAARVHWDDAIYPTLRDLVDLGLIARQDLVKEKTRVAYQLAPARTAEEFHANLRDIDGVLDAGLLMRGGYGMERPGQVPELILNTGRYYWVPLLPPEAGAATSGTIAAAVKPGTLASPEAWKEMLGKNYPPYGEGTAFITNVGRGIFVMNTCENRFEQQTFRLPGVPAAVRQISAERHDAPGAAGVSLTWAFREGDLSYKVHKRVLPETRWTVLAKGLEERKYLDTTADPTQTIAYTITSLTDDKEPFEGVVNFGEYLTLSNVESRIAEEVTIGPLLGVAQSKPIEKRAPAPENPAPWWPNFAGLNESQTPLAAEIVRRIEAWDRAFCAKDLNAVLDLYSQDYEDPTGWRLQYVRRAYQWFFEHYNACVMHRQIRRWDFAAHDTTGQVGVLLYCRFAGWALTDPTGRTADTPAYFPRAGNGEIWVYFVIKDNIWRIVRTNPALPDFKDILSFSASPYDKITLGPDR